MPEKRDITRYKKRLSLKFGIDAPTKLAFTEDLSANGLFIKTVNIAPLGARVKIELTLPDGAVVALEGIVRWSKRVPPQMIHLVKKSGFGVKITKILSGEQSFRQMITECQART
ncbi:MAG TPA: PilZ domain-containing protein [Geobacteraceae bacterium]